MYLASCINFAKWNWPCNCEQILNNDGKVPLSHSHGLFCVIVCVVKFNIIQEVLNVPHHAVD